MLAALIAGLGASGGAAASYFDTGPATIRGLPAAAGEAVLVGFGDVAAKPGDKVEFVGVALAEPSTSVTPGLRILLRRDTGNAGVGAGYPAELPPEIPLGALRLPAGLTLQADDGTAQLILALAAPPDTLTYKGVDVTFRVNGGGEQTQRFPAAGKVCGPPRGLPPRWVARHDYPTSWPHSRDR